MRVPPIIMFFWQLPQNLLAMFVIGFSGARFNFWQGDAEVYLHYHRFGVALGDHIIVDSNASDQTLKHEYGHVLQSRMLGPLYLLVVGLPSITMNILSTILYRAGRPKFLQNYYSRWPESWADRLGNVER